MNASPRQPIPLRVLFIEDSEDDMMLVLALLKQTGYIVDTRRVEDTHGLRTALEDSWDLVLSDYNLPSFNGLDALRIVHEKDPDMPFILLSGIIGEETAVKIMRAGAHDFILKDNMTRLPPAIERELREAQLRREHRKSVSELAQSELRLRTLLDTAADAIIIINQQGIIESVNPATEHLFAYSAQELLGQNIKVLIPEPYRNQHDDYLQRHAEDSIPRIFGIGRELQAQCKDGSILPVNITVTRMEIGGQTMYTGIIRDISSQKLAEKRLTRERDYANKLLDTAPVLILLLDPSGKIIHVNKRFEQMTGYKLDEIRGKEWFSTFLPQRDQDRIRKLFRTSVEGERIRGNINPIVIRNGTELQIEWYDNVLLDDDAKLQELLVIGQDVTERKHAQDVLIKDKIFINAVLDSIEDGIVACNEQGVLTFFNNATREFHGLPQEEIPAENWAEHYDLYLADGVTPMTREDIPLFRALKGERVHQLEMVIAPKDDSKRSLQASGCELRDLHGNKLGAVVSMHDITELKLADAELRKKEAELAEAQAIGHMGSWIWDIKKDSLLWSDEIYRIFGMHPESFEASHEGFIRRVHPDDHELVQTAIDKSLNEMQPYSIDHRIQLPDGSTRFVHEQGQVRFDEYGEPLRMIGTVQDITERKLTEQALRKSETRFRATFEQAAVGVAHVALDGQWLRVNDRLCDIFGYSRPELLKTNFQRITYPDDLQTDLTLVAELLADKRKHYSLEKRYIRKDGDITWIQLTVALVRNSDKQPEYFISVIEDINDRKAAEARILSTLSEKNTVLRELNHRVKNNMQVISSLLSLQARYADRKNPKLALQDSRERIRSMALIHERLYSTTDFDAVDFLDYLRYLGERLERLYTTPDVKPRIQVSGEPLVLTVDVALPCALICNELMTNAIRHAYLPGQQKQLIEIRITDTDSARPQIVVRDYGRGIETDKITSEPTTLGLVIIHALTRQLNGEIQFESTNGTSVSLSFPHNSVTNQEFQQISGSDNNMRQHHEK